MLHMQQDKPISGVGWRYIAIPYFYPAIHNLPPCLGICYLRVAKKSSSRLSHFTPLHDHKPTTSHIILPHYPPAHDQKQISKATYHIGIVISPRHNDLYND